LSLQKLPLNRINKQLRKPNILKIIVLDNGVSITLDLVSRLFVVKRQSELFRNTQK